MLFYTSVIIINRLSIIMVPIQVVSSVHSIALYDKHDPQHVGSFYDDNFQLIRKYWSHNNIMYELVLG